MDMKSGAYKKSLTADVSALHKVVHSQKTGETPCVPSKHERLLQELRVLQMALKDLNKAFLQREIIIREKNEKIEALEKELTRYK